MISAIVVSILFKSKEHKKSFREVIMQLWNCPGQSLDIPRPAKVLTQLRTGITCKHPGGLYISQIWNTFEIVNISLLQKGCHFSCDIHPRSLKKKHMEFPDPTTQHRTHPLAPTLLRFFSEAPSVLDSAWNLWTWNPQFGISDMIYIRTFWNPFFSSMT